jgi:SAM-dependent methyltransferase
MEPTEQNRRAWNEAHRRRAEATADEPALPHFVRERLPDVEGLRVLHLQCASGESTAELAALGALVTAVDLSGEALTVARERDPSIAWVQADVQALPAELRRGRFDLVFTGGAGPAWLDDLEAWAAGIEAALRPGGELFLYAEHPVAACLDETMHWREDYFDERVVAARVGEIVTAVAEAGLAVRSLEELPPQRAWRPQDARVPGEFVLRADKTVA